MRMGLRPHFVYGTYNLYHTDSNDLSLLSARPEVTSSFHNGINYAAYDLVAT